jgi:hypothetical protein
MSLDKTPQLRDEKYLAWVRTQPSCISGQLGCVAHHVISKRFSSQKTSDYMAIPLTDAEHKKLHESWPEWEKVHGEQRMHSLATLLNAIAAGFPFPTSTAAHAKPRKHAAVGTGLTSSKIVARPYA